MTEVVINTDLTTYVLTQFFCWGIGIGTGFMIRMYVEEFTRQRKKKEGINCQQSQESDGQHSN